MRCERARELFSDYCEGSVQAAILVPLEDHLLGCDQCRSEVDELKVVWRILDDAPLVAPPDTFREMVWGRIDAAAEQAPSPRTIRGWRWRSLWTRPALSWAAAAILLLVLAPFVVPGAFSGAGWLGWLSPANRTWTVTALQPSLSGSSVQVPLTVNAVASVPAHVQVVGGRATIQDGADVTLSAGSPANVTLSVEPGNSAPIALRVSWSQDGRSRSQVVAVTPPR